MATDTRNRRPDPAGDQRDALNKAVGKGAIPETPAQKGEVASLDTFNAARPQAAAEAAVAGLALRREDEGLLRGRRGSDEDAGEQNGLNGDQVAQAAVAAQNAWEIRGSDDPRDERSADDQHSMFELSSPALDRLREQMGGGSTTEEAQGTGYGTAAGARPPEGAGGGDGTVSNTGAGGAGNAGAPNVGRGGTDPRTGAAIVRDAYLEVPGAPGMPDMSDPRAGRGFGSDGQLAALQGLHAGLGQHATTPSVAIEPETTQLVARTLLKQVAVEAAEITLVDGPVTIVAGEAVGGGLFGGSVVAGAVVGAAVGLVVVAAVGEVTGANDALATKAAESIGSGAEYAAQMDVNAAVIQGQAEARAARAAADKAAADKVATDKAAADKAAADRAAAEKAAADAKPAPTPKDDLPPGGDDSGRPLTDGQIAFSSYLRNAAHYHGSPGQGEGVTTPTDESGIDTSDPPVHYGTGLVSQPVRDGDGSGRRGPGHIGLRPGDLGNVDNGPDDTGAFVSNPRMAEPADATASLGGSGLSIADARRNSSDEDEDDEDDDDSGT